MTASTPVAQTSGFVYADVPNRAIAYIIDSILVFVIIVLISIILAAVGLATSSVSGTTVTTNYVASLVAAILGLVASGAYFVYMWTSQRATIGMRLLGMQIGNAGDGATLTTNQAIRRFLAVSGPGILVQVFSPIPAIGGLLGLVAIGWVIFLIYTTAKSPTKQGWHDIFANTQVVKAAKSV
jgi:uncharacterized RDD family membrane protein YckC